MAPRPRSRPGELKIVDRDQRLAAGPGETDLVAAERFGEDRRGQSSMAIDHQGQPRSRPSISGSTRAVSVGGGEHDAAEVEPRAVRAARLAQQRDRGDEGARSRPAD